MTSELISIVIPVYNEADNIQVCLKRLQSALGDLDHEILICYDFDEDSTLGAVASMPERPSNVRLVKNDLGRGAAYAIRSGFAAAAGDVVVTTMADLSDPPEIIPDMARRIRDEGADVVSASRYMRGGSQTGGPRLKRFLSRMAGLSLRWFAGLGTRDATNNFRAYSKKFLESVEVESDMGFELALELTVKAHLKGCKITEVPTSWVDRSAGESRFRMWRWMPRYLKWYLRAMSGTLLSRSNLMAAAVFCLLWISVMSLPEKVVNARLDLSWRQALTEAAKHNFQAGSDYVFTFGPLGRFYNMLYDTDSFHFQLSWEVCISLFVALIITLVFLRLKPITERVAFLVVAVLVLPISRDALYVLTIVATAVLLVTSRRRRFVAALAIGLPLLAVASLMKFTLFVTALVCVLVVFAALWRLRGAGAALATLAAYLALLALAWLLSGQSFYAFPSYLSGSLELSTGYSEAMSRNGPFAQVLLGMLCCALTAVLAGLSTLGASTKTRAVTSSALIAVGFFVAWKTGFVRHDLHAFTFFAFASGAGFLLIKPDLSRPVLRKVFTVVLFVLVAASLLGVGLTGRLLRDGAGSFIGNWRWDRRVLVNVNTLLSPRLAALRGELQLRKARRKHALPRIRRAVGDRAVDILSYNQGLLFLNGLNWHPRPVFQSYSAYTPRLIAMNAAFFRGARAPEFVIITLQPIDERFPATEDAGALAVILRDYAPVLFEKGCALLRRISDAPSEPGEGTVLLERQVSFDEPVDVAGLPGACQSLSIGLEWSTTGKLRKFLFKAPRVTLKVVTDAGEKLEFRIVPGMVESGFILNPFFETQDDLIAWCKGAPSRQINSFSISVAPEHLMYFRPSITVSVLSSDLKQPVGPPD